MPWSRIPRRLLTWLLLLWIFSQACALPGLMRSTPTFSPPPPTSTAMAELLPPAMVESSPLAGSEIALDEAFTLTFNQPMDRTSVEGALAGVPGSSISLRCKAAAAG